MTISSEARKAGPYVGNGVATSFPFTFKVFSPDDVAVLLRAAGGVETQLANGGDYRITLNGNQEFSPGGSITKTTPLATGERLAILSRVPNLQTVELTNQGGFYPRVINAALDRVTILAQQNAEALRRSLKFNATDDEVSPLLPSCDERRGTVLAFHETTGAPIVGPSIAEVGSVAGALAAIHTVAGSIGNVNITADHIGAVDAVAASIDAVETVASNMLAILDAPAHARMAAASAAAASASELAAAASAAAASTSESVAVSSANSASASASAAADSAREAAKYDPSMFVPKTGGSFSGAITAPDIHAYERLGIGQGYSSWQITNAVGGLSFTHNGNGYLTTLLVVGLKGLMWKGNDIGRWAEIDPSSKADALAFTNYWAKSELSKVSKLINDSGYLTEGDSDARYAKPAYVDSAIANLVASSPSTLDTLNELAAALGDDPNFATTVANQIGTKADAVTTSDALASKLPASHISDADPHPQYLTPAGGDARYAGSASIPTRVSQLSNDSGFVGQSAIDASFVSEIEGGVPDWNAVVNTRPGVGPALLMGTATNGPGSASYFHALNFEYSSSNGEGNVTTLAIPYGSPADELFYRGRYSGAWTPWRKVWSSFNFDPSLLMPKAGGEFTGDVKFKTLNVADAFVVSADGILWKGKDISGGGSGGGADTSNCMRQGQGERLQWAFMSATPSSVAIVPKEDVSSAAMPAAQIQFNQLPDYGIFTSPGGFHTIAMNLPWSVTARVSAFSSWANIQNNNAGARFDMGWSQSGFWIGLRKGGVAASAEAMLDFDGTWKTQKTGTLSDRRNKSGLEIIECALDKLDALCGYTYHLNKQVPRSAGLIAQDAQQVIPEAVSANAEGTLSMDYSAIIALLVNAVNELKKEVRALKVGS